MHNEWQIGDSECYKIKPFGEIVVTCKEELALVMGRIEEECCIQLGLVAENMTVRILDSCIDVGKAGILYILDSRRIVEEELAFFS